VLNQIRAACPLDPQGNPLASHYNLAMLQDVTDQNKKGAGRPTWIDKEPIPLTTPPDASPGRYMLAFYRPDPDRGAFRDVDRMEILLLLAPATHAEAPAPSPPTAAETNDPTLAAIRGGLELAGIASSMKAGSFADVRELVQFLTAELGKKDIRIAGLEARVDTLLNDKIALVELLTGKFQTLSEHLAKLPAAPQEMPYITVIRELMTGFTAAIDKVAPGINAKLGAPQPAAKALPASGDSSTADKGAAPAADAGAAAAPQAAAPGGTPAPVAAPGTPAPQGAAPATPPAAAPSSPAPATPASESTPPPGPAPGSPPAQGPAGEVEVQTDPLPEDRVKDVLSEFSPQELAEMRERLKDPAYKAQLLREVQTRAPRSRSSRSRSKPKKKPAEAQA
jgi:hypothetical protein